MKCILNLKRYRFLLKKEKNLNSNEKSLFFENKSEFLEFLSYSIKLKYLISYQNREKYYSLISKYLNGLITAQSFQLEFSELERNYNSASKILLNDIKKFDTFSLDLISIKFGLLINKIAKLVDFARAFDVEIEKGISNHDFFILIKKIYSRLLILKNRELRVLINNSYSLLKSVLIVAILLCFIPIA